MLTPLKPTHCHSLCVLNISPPAVSPVNKLVTSNDLFSHLVPIISSLSSFSDSSWKCFLLVVPALWPSWEHRDEGSFCRLHRGVACSSGRSIKPEQCWVSYRALWRVMCLGWLRHPTQMKSEPGHFLAAFSWAVGAIYTQHGVTGLLVVLIETLVLSKLYLVPAQQLHPTWSNYFTF